MKANPRLLAITILCQRQETGQPVDLIRDNILTKAMPDNAKDSPLVTALVYGVLRWQRYLDAILQDFSSHPLAKMKNLTLQALRVGLFQLCFMDRIPPSAAVNETVKALKESRQPKWLTGFVNGLLRNISRQMETLPSHWDNSLMPPAVRLSHPDWLYQRWLVRYGEDQTLRICTTNNHQGPLVLRVNSTLMTREGFINELEKSGIAAQPGIYCPEAVVLPDFRGDIGGLPGYASGTFMVQDEGAQLISLMLGPFGSGKYLDACAGLGGKTVHLAQLIPDGSQVVAIEPNPMRFKLLQENIKRTGMADRVSCRQTTLGDFQDETDGFFAAILVDAPCSGLGVIRRHPDIRWNRNPDDLQRYPAEQLKLLAEAAALLVPGGILVYATCSIEPEENEEVVAQFLAAQPQFTLSSPPDFPPAAQRFVNTKGFFQTQPDETLDGFFAARLVKSKE
ncbi:MAG: 16S rRNA (cytosine(967)-C(5))-methyltransferase RsmB [Proteobacteria bacterium]|nr:16S rRNA (cytosine(967)-C(5))-methyltransferase RsmB [Pseudomonadota bacterium]MBU4296552.1 16S rRNA (cytosine(967)-C(5))-methyltransferase RsmB [Pseudomonadota bacterium]MCG2748805.1 16S rRNA (cytosine(967)-C(5))-methyltransferase RsmB [Desulfobulbaceae bacterium]